MRLLTVFYFLIFFCFSQSWSFDLSSVSSQTKRAEFESGFSSYDSKTGEIYLATSAVVRQIDSNDFILKKISSQEILVKSEEGKIIMKFPFIMEDSSGTIKAQSGYYDYLKNEGELKNGTFKLGRFILRGKSITVKEGKYSYKSASLTTCDMEEPHYRIGAHKILLSPGKYFLAYSTVFYLGKVPIFYFPFIYKPLGEGTPILSQFYPGYDERNGFYIKSNYIYKFNRYSRAKLFIDYFSKKGLGTGTEIDYYRPERNISSFSYYRIREYGDNSHRWGINGGMWHSFAMKDSSAYFQTYARLLSDPDFNNDFFRSNPFAVSSEKQAGAAFTYNASKTNTRLSYYVKYLSVNDNSSFVRAYETAPKLDFNTVPLKPFGVPFWNTWNFYIENAKNDTPYYQTSAYGAWTVSLPVKVYKSFNLYPSAFYYQNVYFSTSSAVSDSFIGRYGTRINARKTNSWGSLDLDFYSLRRNAQNKMRLDKTAADKGVEKQELSFSAFWIRSSASYLRFSGAYDLRDYPSSKNFADRFMPLSLEIYNSGKNKEIFFQDSYDLSSGNKSFISQLNFGDDKDYFGFGLANYDSDRTKWIVSNSIGFVPPIPGKWRAEIILRYWTDFSKEGFKAGFFEKSAVIYKEFHDFRTKFNIRVREGVKEFFVYLTLKMNDPYRKDELSSKADYFWRPWRKPGEPRD
ncbi:MAG: hypothetical protein AB1637_02770 [Elusimicrobiota bacterium]